LVIGIKYWSWSYNFWVEPLRNELLVLFCSYEILFLVSLESSWRGGVHGLWFHNIWTCSAKVCKYWMISSLKIKLIRSSKFWRNRMVLLERSWWAGFNGIYLVRFGFRMWGILIFRVISAAENSNKLQKNQVLEGKIS
jgi:hypothetical protein